MLGMSANLILSLYHFFIQNINSFFDFGSLLNGVGPTAKAVGLLEKSLQFGFQRVSQTLNTYYFRRVIFRKDEMLPACNW